MLIAIAAMIGMTGFAMAGSTTDVYVGDGSYYTDFSGYGTGDITILSQTSYGTDIQRAEWTDTRVNGWQEMDTDSMHGVDYTQIERQTTVGKQGYGQDASGTIFVQSADNAYGSGDTLTAVATYHDDEAYGSHVTLKQTAKMCDDGAGFERVSADTLIKGFAYGADTLVSGYIGAKTDGQNNVIAFATIDMNEGRFRMHTFNNATDYQSGLEASWLRIKNMKGVGNGTACIGVHSTDAATAEWDVDITNDDLDRSNNDAYFHGDPVSVTFTDNFDSNYHATGYVYVYTP